MFAAARCRKSFSVHEFVVDSVLFPTKNFNEKKFPDFLQQFFSLVPLRKNKTSFEFCFENQKVDKNKKTTEEKVVFAILSLFRVRQKME